MNIYEKILEMQKELKCGKTQYNDFGNYYYRNCEDILEALKPICDKNKVLVYLTDTLELIGNRNYVKATATAINLENTEEKISVTAFAREEETKKGMDGSQITGASSSYARKYALNGLFAIDDTRDSDTTNKQPTTTTVQKTQSKPIGNTTNNSGTTNKQPINPDSEITFGKHKGETWAEVFIDDKTYFDYVIKAQKTPEQAQRIKNLYNQLVSDNAKYEKQAKEAVGDYKSINPDYIDDFEQVLIQNQ